MRRRRLRQLQLGFETKTVRWLPKEKEQEVVEALAELLLAAVMESDGDERKQDDEQ